MPRCSLALALSFAGLAAVGVACSPVAPLESIGTVSERRGLSQVAVDTRIYDDATSAAKAAAPEQYADTSIMVYQRRIAVVGAGRSLEANDAVLNAVRRVEGVVEVFDGLRVLPKLTTGQGVDDGGIEARIKARLVGTAEVSSVDFRWRSVRGTVYLMGLARDAKERDAAIAVIRDVQGVRDVVNWVRLL